MEAQTVDQVATGEQQPESDHGFQGERTEAGVFKNRHWRHAKGWFSYNLRKRGPGARILRITYYGADKDRQFNILVNNQLLKREQLQGTAGDKFVDIDYELPSNLLAQSSDVVTVKFLAEPGSTAGGVYYVRLLRKL